MTASRERPPPPLHVVTDDRVLGDADFIARAEAVLEAGGGRLALHVRGPATPTSRLFALASSLSEDARRTGALLLVNDRVDVALASRADGVHLRERSLPASAARALLPAGAWLGASVHGGEGAHEAAGRPLDYLVMGTVFATPSHPGRKGTGPGALARARAETALPLVAIGGITPDRVPGLLQAGAAGVAVLSGVWSSADPAVAVTRYLAALEAVSEGPGASGRGGAR